MNRVLGCTGLTVLAVFMVSTPAIADEPKCEVFELIVGEGSTNVIDTGPDGLSIGDSRVGARDLLNADGDVVGELLFNASVVSEKDGMYRLMGDVHYVFDSGRLHFATVYELPDPSTPDLPKTLPSFEYHATGGVGAFEGVSGSTKTTSHDDGSRKIVFNISCTN